MAATTDNRKYEGSGSQLDRSSVARDWNGPIKANVHLYRGQLVGQLFADTAAAPTIDNWVSGGTMRCIGFMSGEADNTGGALGARAMRAVAQTGQLVDKNAGGGSAITMADLFKPAYGVDNQTCSKLAADGDLIGVITGLDRDSGNPIILVDPFIVQAFMLLSEDPTVLHKALAETVTGVKTFASGADPAFAKEANHSLAVNASTTASTAGGNFSQVAAAGTPAASGAVGGAGGVASTVGGAGGAAFAAAASGAGAGGAAQLTGGVGGAAAANAGGTAAVGGAAQVAGGVGGAASANAAGAIGGAASVTAGAGGAGSSAQVGGAGAVASLVGGAGGVAAGAGGGIGGAVSIAGGVGSVADTATIAAAGGAMAAAGGAGGAATTSFNGAVGGVASVTGGAGGVGAAGKTAGAGAAATMLGGAGGAAGGGTQGNGGNARVDAGAGLVNGAVLIGDTSAAAVTVARAGVNNSLLGQINQTVGAVLTISGNVLAPTANIHHVGAGLIKNITPTVALLAGAVLQLVPDAAFTYDNTGNIVVPSGGGTATINKLMTFVWDGTKWTPSY